jgi:hypothetical protein
MQWSGMGLLQHEGFTRAVLALISDLAARLHADGKVCVSHCVSAVETYSTQTLLAAGSICRRPACTQ